MSLAIPENCNEPIIVDNFPPSDNSEYRIICNFTPKEIDGNIGTSTIATSYIWASNNHVERKEYHFTQRLSTDKAYFYKGEKVYGLSGSERVGYFGEATQADNHLSKMCWHYTEILAIFAVLLFVVASVKKERKGDEMAWWQELIGILFTLTFCIFYLLLFFIFISRR